MVLVGPAGSSVLRTRKRLASPVMLGASARARPGGTAQVSPGASVVRPPSHPELPMATHDHDDLVALRDIRCIVDRTAGQEVDLETRA